MALPTSIETQAESNRYFNYPYAALKEALANAVYHKGYDSREPIEVRILPDRIEILPHPGADRSISISNLRRFRASSRRYRNRRIGEFLKELHLTEGRNTGITKCYARCPRTVRPSPSWKRMKTGCTSSSRFSLVRQLALVQHLPTGGQQRLRGVTSAFSPI